MPYDVWQSCVLVPGLSQSACASWVQAWGSIGALAVAIALPLRGERRLRREANRSVDKFFIVVRTTLEGMRDASQSMNASDFNMLGEYLERYLEFPPGLDISHADTDHQTAVLAVRGIAGVAVRGAKQQGHAFGDQAVTAFDGLLKQMASIQRLGKIGL